MAPTSSPRRLHRLPQRLDYKLIPAPLDLSLPLATEKSSLPAIIVTPSSPSSSHDFSIAFLADPPKPTLRERLTNLPVPFCLRARTLIVLSLLFIILICHVVTHRLAAQRPYLEFSVQEGSEPEPMSFSSWLGLHDLWEPGTMVDDKRDFIVTEEVD